MTYLYVTGLLTWRCYLFFTFTCVHMLSCVHGVTVCVYVARISTLQFWFACLMAIDLPKAYPVHVMVLVAVERARAPIVWGPDCRVTKPGARPLTESKKQVQSSGLLNKVDRRKGKSCCHFHRNRAWSAESKRLGLQHRQVCHQNIEFAQPVDRTSPGLSNLGGTQCMDRWWLALKQYIPSSLNRNVKKDGRSALNPKIEALLYQWVWRAHMIRSLAADEVLVQVSALF